MSRKSETKNYLNNTQNYSAINTFYLPKKITAEGIPIISASEYIPDSVFQYASQTMASFKSQMPPNCACHFFTDDFRFSATWSKPKRMINILKGFSGVFAPDYTLSFDFPLIVNKWNHYRKMWVSAFWRSQGIEVIPVANWLDEESYSWCFEGMPLNSVIALSAHEIYEPSEIHMFLKGFKYMEFILKPKLIIMIGGKKQLNLLEKMSYCPILYFAPR